MRHLPHHALLGPAIALLLAVGVTAAPTPARAQEPEPAPAQPSNPEPTLTRDVSYGPEGDTTHLLDIYLPQDGAKNRPAVILVHGGGWVSGDKFHVALEAVTMARRGFVAVSIAYDYKRPDQDRWPGELEDAQMAVRWVQDNAATYDIDPNRLGIFGSSAGGNLAMLVGTKGVGDGHPPVKAVASWSGPTNLVTLAPTNVPGEALAEPTAIPVPGAEVPNGCIGVGNDTCMGVASPQYIQGYMGCTLPECPDKYHDASPVDHVRTSTPPMFIANSMHEMVPMSQVYEMANVLSNAGVASELLVMDGVLHAGAFRDVALDPTIAFFGRYLVDGADPHVATHSPPSTVAGSAALPSLEKGYLLPIAPEPVLPADRNRWLMIGAAVVVVLVAGLFLARRRTARSSRRRSRRLVAAR